MRAGNEMRNAKPRRACDFIKRKQIKFGPFPLLGFRRARALFRVNVFEGMQCARVTRERRGPWRMKIILILAPLLDNNKRSASSLCAVLRRGNISVDKGPEITGREEALTRH